MPSSPGHPALAPFGTTIFATMSALAAEHGAINLGQGFPDTDGPAEVLEAAVAAIRAGLNQYPPGPGVPALLEAVAAHQSRFYGLSVDPRSEVLVTVGATEAIAATVLALVRPGDEVVTFEPYYDSYAATIALAGGVRRTSVLRFPDFAVDEASLRAAFSSRTRVVLLNTPHNPTGKVFTRAELDLVCELAREHDAWVVTDEVYEHLTFDGVEHVPVATLPGMRERTLTISSAGKTFSTTGWKVGWVSGPGGGDRGGAGGEAVRDLRRVRAVPARGGHRPRSRRRRVRRARRVAAGQARPAGGGAARGRDGRVRARRGRTSSSPTRLRSGRSTPCRSATSCRNGPGSSGCRSRSSTTTSTPPARWCGSRSARRTRSSTRRAGGWLPSGAEPAPSTGRLRW